MSTPRYFSLFPNVEFSREGGVLEMCLHTGGHSLIFDAVCHRDLGDAFYEVGKDAGNRVVIFTGKGSSFCSKFDYRSFAELYEDLGKTEAQRRIVGEGRRMTQAFLEIEVPVISAVNGPLLAHSELAVMADLVLASETAIFQDAVHFVADTVPGDGVQLAWLNLLGPNRGRHFLLSGKRLSALEAHQFGVVAEILAVDALMPRARTLAAKWARKPAAVLRGTREVLNAHWRDLVTKGFTAGFAQETIAVMSDFPVAAGAPEIVDLMGMSS